MGAGKIGKTLESQVRGFLVKGQSCSLGGQAAVAEELADDSWVSHSRGVTQVMVILSDLAKHSPHDFPWETIDFRLPGDKH